MRIAAGVLTLALTAGSAACGPALAQSAAPDKVRIGLITTLTGQGAVLGQHQRDGFLLAVKQFSGKLGGLDVEVIVADDELKPDVAVQKVQGLIERDRVVAATGVIFSNVMMAIAKPLAESGTPFVGSNAGPAPLAGRACSPLFFTTSYQNDQNHEVLGRHAEESGLKRMVIMAPNYQAGRDALAGFKRHFKGEILDEVYTQVGQVDYSAEIARIASEKPDGVFVFLPGGMGVNFVKQYQQAGVRLPLLSAFTVDETSLPATQESAVGLLSGAQWAPGLDTPGTKAFVAAFEAEYGYVPAMYAANSYDAALLLDAALKSIGPGKANDRAALAKAIREVRFDSIRGDFRFGANGFPIQDFWLVKVEKRPDGRFQTTPVRKVFDAYADVYAKDCPLK